MLKKVGSTRPVLTLAVLLSLLLIGVTQHGTNAQEVSDADVDAVATAAVDHSRAVATIKPLPGSAITSIVCYVSLATGQVLGLATTATGGSTTQRQQLCTTTSYMGVVAEPLVFASPITGVSVTPMGTSRTSGVASFTVTTVDGKQYTCGRGGTRPASEQSLKTTGPENTAMWLQSINAKCGRTTTIRSAQRDAVAPATKSVKNAIIASTMDFEWVQPPAARSTGLLFQFTFDTCPSQADLDELASAMEKDMKLAGAEQVLIKMERCVEGPIPPEVSPMSTAAEPAQVTDATGGQVQMTVYMMIVDLALESIKLCASRQANVEGACAKCLPDTCKAVERTKKRLIHMYTHGELLPPGSYRKNCAQCRMHGCNLKCSCWGQPATWDYCKQPCLYLTYTDTFICEYLQWENPIGPYQKYCDRSKCNFGVNECNYNCHCTANGKTQKVTYSFCDNFCPIWNLAFDPDTFTLACNVPKVSIP